MFVSTSERGRAKRLMIEDTKIEKMNAKVLRKAKSLKKAEAKLARAEAMHVD
jgi:hypothetical protein